MTKAQAIERIREVIRQKRINGDFEGIPFLNQLIIKIKAMPKDQVAAYCESHNINND